MLIVPNLRNTGRSSHLPRVGAGVGGITRYNMVKKNKNQPKPAQKKAAPKKAAPKKAKKQQQQKKGSVRKIANNSVSITSVNEGVGFHIKPFKQQDQMLEGCDYLATVVVSPAQANTSVVLFNRPINPLTLIANSRCARIAGLYDQFSIESMSFHYATSVGTSTAGSLLMAWDADPADNYSDVSGDTLLTDLNSMDCNVNFSTYRNASMSIPRSSKLWVQAENSGDQRLVNHGRLWIATEGGVAAGTYGRILVKWKIKFYRPNLDPDVATIGYAASISANNGSQISATYPWGDFTSIMATSPSNVSPSYNSSIVTFQSTVPGTSTAASTIVFQAAGQYRVTINRTGTAIGTSAYTPTGTSGVLFGGSGTTAAGWPYSSVGSLSLANGGSTATVGWFDVNATAGGYVYATGDSGPTHSTGYVTVLRYPNSNIPPPAAADPKLESGEISKLKQLLLNLNLAGTQKLAPFIDNGKFASSTQTYSVPSPAGEPVLSYVSSTNGSMDVGPVPVIVEAPAAQQIKTNEIKDLVDALVPESKRSEVHRRLKFLYSPNVLMSMPRARLEVAIMRCQSSEWDCDATNAQS